MRRHAKAPPVGATLHKSSHGRFPRPSVIAALFVALSLVACLVPASALALEHPFFETFGSAEQPSFANPSGMVVDQSTGDLLVIENEVGAISRWNPDGTPSEFSALGSNAIDGAGTGDETPQGSLSFGGSGEVQIAVDNSGGATDGNIYVPQAGAKVVDVFASSGEYLGQLTESSAGPFSEPCGIAVDPSGNVYVGDFSGTIQKYEPAANPPENSDNSANFAFASNCTLAAGAGPTNGFIFPAHFNGSVAKLDSTTGEEKYEVDAGPTTTLSVDPSNGHLYTARGEAIAEFNATGASGATEVSTTALTGAARGVAIDGSTGNLYTTREGSANVEVFEPLVEFPLTVKKGAGGGEGTVQSSPDGINCDPACPEKSAEFIEGEVVELEATPESNSEFAGWSALSGDPGTCTGTTLPCEVTMGEAVELEADFELRPVPAVTAISPTEGPTAGANPIVITGTGLAEATKVEFGSTVVEAPFTENTATKIKLNAPAHAAGKVNVRVTTLGGTSLNFPVDDYTYEVPAPAPKPPVNLTPTPPLGENLPLPLQCVVPKLKGLSLAKAKSALTNAHCKVGEVGKPKARKGKKLGPLVVKSSQPGAGAALSAQSEVDLALGRKPRANTNRGGVK